MVKDRHAPRRGSSITDVAYANRARPSSRAEVLRLSDVVRRVSPEELSRTQRLHFHVVALFVAGRCRHTVDFAPVECAPGTVLFVRPGQVQRWHLTPSLEALLLLFSSEFLSGAHARPDAPWYERLVGELAWPVSVRLGTADRAAVEDTFRRLERTYATLDTTPVSDALLRHLVSAALLDVARRAGIGAHTTLSLDDSDRVSRFRREVERSFCATRRVLDYAKRLGCTARTLDRCCTEALGCTAKAYVDARVTLEARRLLAHSAMSVGAVGTSLGFSDATNFVKFFRARTGQLPGAFRAETQR